MLQLLRDLRKKAVIGFVGGSNLSKITEQLGVNGSDRAYMLRGLDSCSDSNLMQRFWTLIMDFRRMALQRTKLVN